VGELRPYWQSSDGLIKVFHAPCEAVIASVLPVREVALVHADPPYGVKHDTRLRNRGGPARKASLNGGTLRPRAHDFPPIPGDDKPFDPAGVLALARPTVLWGANHYASRLPDSPSWILWDKRDGVNPNDGADGELAWSNLGGTLRIFRHVWSGLCRASESGGSHGSPRHLHPTQKPAAMSTWIFSLAKLKRGDLVFVPYLGSGPDLPAAQAMGLRVIACDVERWCLDTAIGRLGAITTERAAEPCGPLFGAPVKP